MSDADLPRFIYLVVLLCAMGGYFVASRQQALGKTMQQAIIWGMLFTGVAAGYALWQSIIEAENPRQSMTATGRLEVPVSPDGHYYVMAEVNGVPVRFVVDTGATEVVLSRRDAKRAGIDPAGLAYLGRASTANGTVASARVRLDSFRIGDFVDHGISASVTDGDMFGSLLGMTYLSRFASVSIERGRLILER